MSRSGKKSRNQFSEDHLYRLPYRNWAIHFNTLKLIVAVMLSQEQFGVVLYIKIVVMRILKCFYRYYSEVYLMILQLCQEK